MGDLISSKEAKLAWANGVDVQISHNGATLEKEWHDLYGTLMLSAFDSDMYEFRLKPRTITLNGIEVPAPFIPKDEEVCWVLSTNSVDGCGWLHYSNYEKPVQFGAWRTEEEIKQVVAALRKVFTAE